MHLRLFLPFSAALLAAAAFSPAYSQQSAGGAGQPSLLAELGYDPIPDTLADSSSLPDAPGFFSPAEGATKSQRGGEPWEGERHYGPLSRIGIGGDVGSLGIGIKATTVLTETLDARLLINFFHYDTGIFEIEGYRADTLVHLLSVGGTVDFYPMNSIWRVSGGLLAHNGNDISVTSEIIPGTSFKVNGLTYYSANPNPATGAVPITGSGVLGLNAREPEFLVSGGFGRFIPRSERHWSFPSEFGVIFMGQPTINLNVAGWVCKDSKQTNCTDVNAPSDPLAAEFQTALQAQEQRWRNSLRSFTIYPMFSYSVVYSFDFR